MTSLTITLVDNEMPETTSGHTTANEPVEAVDPGGTRPAKAGKGDAPSKPDPQTVVSGNQNQPANERAR